MKAAVLAALLLGPGAAAVGAAPLAAPAGGAWDLTVFYAGDLFRNTRGGIRTGGAYLDSLDVTLAWDGERGFGVPGLTAQALVLYNNGGSISRHVGDSFLLSNIETVEAWRLYEAWLQYAPSQAERSVKVGLYDLNTEFDATETGALFLNSTFGIGADLAQSGLAGPSVFPLTSLAVRGMWRFDARWRVQAALLDGVPGDPADPGRTAVKLSDDDGVLGALELERNAGATRWVLGLWRYSAAFDDLAATGAGGSPRRSRGNGGAYAFVETPVAALSGAGRAATALLRLGRADGRFNEFRDTVHLSVAWSGGLTGREGERAGVGLARGWRGEDARAAAAAAGEALLGHETVVELTWKLPVTPRLSLQPDVQYIMRPGGVPGRRDALAIGLRFDLQVTDP